MRPVAKLSIETSGDTDRRSGLRSFEVPAMVFDSQKNHLFTANVDRAKGEEGVESFLNARIPGVPREVAKQIPDGAYIKLEAGYAPSGRSGPNPGVVSLFYGQVYLAYDEVSNGTRELIINADATPEAFREVGIYISMPRSKGKSYRVGDILESIETQTGLSIDAPESFTERRVLSFTAPRTGSGAEDVLLRLIAIINRTFGMRSYSGTGQRYTITVNSDNPSSYRIIDAKDQTGTVNTLIIERMSRFAQHTGPVFVKAGTHESLMEDPFFPARRRDPETGKLQTLQALSFEDRDEELTNIEYSVDSFFDPRFDLDRVIEIHDEGDLLGYISSVHTVSHSVGDESTSWRTNCRGPFAQFPIEDTPEVPS